MEIVMLLWVLLAKLATHKEKITMLPQAKTLSSESPKSSIEESL